MGRMKLGSKAAAVLYLAIFSLVVLISLARSQEVAGRLGNRARIVRLGGRHILSGGEEKHPFTSGKETLKWGLEIISAELVGLATAEVIEVSVEGSI